MRDLSSWPLAKLSSILAALDWPRWRSALRRAFCILRRLQRKIPRRQLRRHGLNLAQRRTHRWHRPRIFTARAGPTKHLSASSKASRISAAHSYRAAKCDGQDAVDTAPYSVKTSLKRPPSHHPPLRASQYTADFESSGRHRIATR